MKNLLGDTNRTGKDERFNTSLMIGRVAQPQADDTQTNVRVIFPDKVDDKGTPLISKPMPVGQISAGNKRSFAMPRVGQNVLVAKLPNSTSEMVQICSFYTTSDPPPVTDPDLDYTEYIDGKGTLSVMQFNAKTGQLDWKITGNYNLETVTDYFVKAAKALIEAGDITLKGNVKIEGNLTVTGTSTLQGGGEATPSMKNTDGSGGGT